MSTGCATCLDCQIEATEITPAGLGENTLAYFDVKVSLFLWDTLPLFCIVPFSLVGNILGFRFFYFKKETSPCAGRAWMTVVKYLPTDQVAQSLGSQ